MLHLSGQLDEAAAHYRRAFELRPDNAEAHGNLGRLLTTEGRHREAADEFTRALAINPDSPSFLSGLAWLLALSSDKAVLNPGEAIRVGTRAAELSGRRDPAALDALGAAYAAAGDFGRSVEMAQEAMRVADASGMQALWVDIRDRLQLYQRGLPFVLK